jgi:hypothetical protein
MTPLLLDAPIASPAEEKLGREPFANSLADLLHDAPQDASFRIGVYGEWGEGKTSVLLLMQRRLESKGDVCVWLPAWIGRNKEDTWGRLVAAIADAVGVPVKKSPTLVKQVVAVATRAADATGVSKAISNAVTPFINEALANYNASSLEALLTEVRAHLGERKVIVFVDDLDRVTPDLVPDLLMSLREIFDLPGLFFVLALSPTVIEHGLKRTGFGGERPAAFLDKIVELPMQLPPLSDRAINEFIEYGISSLPDTVDQPALRSLISILPRNPRRIKLFLRFIACASAQWGRFLADEVDWRTLYVVQMLALEYPEESRRLSLDSVALDRMEWGRTRDGVYPTKAQTTTGTVEHPEDPYAASLEGENQKRFLALCAAIRERTNVMRGKYALWQLFHFVDEPPTVSWRELDDLIRSYTSTSETDRVQRVRAWLTGASGGRSVPDTARALFKLVLEAREAMLDIAIAAESPSEITRILANETIPLGQLLHTLAIDLGFFSDGTFTVVEWKELAVHIRRWSSSHVLRQFAPVVNADAKLLLNVSKELRIADQVMILGTLAADRIEWDAEASSSTRSAFKTAYALFEKSRADMLLGKFEERDGLDAYWAVGNTIGGKGALFTPGSPFHSASARKRLAKIGRRGKKDDAVHLNFVTYFRMLTYGAFKEGGSFVQKDCRELLHDVELVTIVWSAAVGRPTNPRIAGSLRDDRQSIIATGVPESALPLPDWLRRLEKAFFSRRPPAGGTIDASADALSAPVATETAT